MKSPGDATDVLIEQPASRLMALAVDAALAVGCYFAAFALRFDAAEFSTFLPSALRTLPLITVSQVAALLAFRAYTYRRGRRWFPRLLAGILSGTAAGALLEWLTYGFQGISRISFAVDAVLFSLAAFGWRAAIGLIRLARVAREAQARPHEMEDRSAPPSVSAGLLGLVRYRELLRNLVLRDVKLKYRGSVFGFFWSLANPILMVFTYTVAFRYIMQVRTEGFIFNLLLGLLNWTFFTSSAMMSTGSVVGAGALVKSVAFPRVILPVATVLFNLVQFVFAIAVFLPLLLVMFGIVPTPAILLFPLLLTLQILFTSGVAFALASLTSFFRDVSHILEIGLAILFWTTPILYQYGSLPEYLQVPILLSPMSSFIVAYQEMFHYGRVPGLPIWLAAGSWAVGMFVLGASLFVDTEDQLAEQV
jgi:ABC-type polysaccharide/polyol phosphate export permease